MSAASPSQGWPLVIYDLCTGWLESGHQEDYLAALERALAAYSVRVVAPFRGGMNRLRSGKPITIFERAAIGLRALRGALQGGRRSAVIIPNPSPLDFVLTLLAVFTLLPGARGHVLMFMRRDAKGIVGGDGWRRRFLESIVRALSRISTFHLISDARMAAEFWSSRTGKEVLLVSIPVRRLASDPAPASSAGIRVGLLGAFRMEKGARHYPEVIRCALALDSAVEIDCQCPSRPGSEAEADCLRSIGLLAADPRVRLHVGHLDSEAYVRLLYGADVVVLPYDVESYGPGTSGVLFEAVAAGAVVVSTRISWAAAEYASHPNVIWLDGIREDILRPALAAAVEAVRQRRLRQDSRQIQPDRFQVTWTAAIDLVGRRFLE